MSKSFRTFLLAYCQELTGLKTSSLKLMGKSAATQSPRALEPLVLLAILDGRESYLLKHVEGSASCEPCRSFLRHYQQSGLSLFDYLESLPDGNRFKRPLSAWRAEAQRTESDKRVMADIAAKMQELIDHAGMSRAEACRITGLNKGNFYAFLKGDTSKLSRDTAIGAYRLLATE